MRKCCEIRRKCTLRKGERRVRVEEFERKRYSKKVTERKILIVKSATLDSNEHTHRSRLYPQQQVWPSPTLFDN